MLDHTWVIPAIPAVMFWVILGFGKRLPNKGHELGVAGVAASFVLSCIVAVQWIGRSTSVAVGEGEHVEHLRRAVDGPRERREIHRLAIPARDANDVGRHGGRRDLGRRGPA